MIITVYDWQTLEPLNDWRCVWLKDRLYLRGLGDTLNEGREMEVHSASKPTRTPGWTLVKCHADDSCTYYYRIPTRTYDEIIQAGVEQ